MIRAVRGLVIVVAVVVALFGWANRAGRYQIVRAQYQWLVMVDTATGEQLLYTVQHEKGRWHFQLEAQERPVPLLARLVGWPIAESGGD